MRDFLIETVGIARPRFTHQAWADFGDGEHSQSETMRFFVILHFCAQTRLMGMRLLPTTYVQDPCRYAPASSASNTTRSVSSRSHTQSRKAP